MLAGVGRLDRLLIADIDPGRAVHRLAAVAGAVDLAHRERVDAELTGEFVDAALDRKGGDRRPRRPIGCDLRSVAQDVVAGHDRVRQVVDREAAHAALVDRRTRKGAGLVFQNRLHGGDMAILLGAELDFNDRARGRPRRAEHLVPAHNDLDRPAGLLRQQIGDRFEIDDRLAAKPAADLGRDRPDAGNVGAADARGVGAHHELTLARAPDRALPVGPDRHEAGMRLDVGLVHRFCRVAPLDDQIGLLEAGFDIAFREADHLRDVGGLIRLGLDAGGEDIVVHERRIGCHRRLDIHDVRQDLIRNLDQIKRLLGDRGRGRRDGGDGVSFVERLALCHAVERQVAQIVRRSADMRLVRRYVGKIGAGDDRLHARKRQRLSDIDRNDTGMRVWAALDPAPQHAGHRHVGAEIGAAGDLVDPIGTDRAGADEAQRGFIEIAHALTPSKPANVPLPHCGRGWLGAKPESG